MNEEDTFNKLRRTPFSEMYDQYHFTKHTTTDDYYKWLKDNYWTNADFWDELNRSRPIT